MIAKVAKCVRCGGIIATETIEDDEILTIVFPITEKWEEPHKDCGSPLILTEDKLLLWAVIRKLEDKDLITE